MKRKFNSLEGLRLFAFFNVFLLHIGSYRITNFQNCAAWAVSFFFMISGFLYGFKLFPKKNIKCSDTTRFTIKKILKIYPLYITTLLLMIPFSGIITNNSINQGFWDFLKSFIYNITLIQSFASNVNISYAFNGVSWFLSSYIFLMLITIPLLLLLKKFIKNKKQAIFFLMVITLCGFIYVDFLTYLKADVIMWVYVFPISRLFEYVAGILLGIIFSYSYKEIRLNIKKKIIYTIIELVTISLLIVSFYFLINAKPYDLTVIWIIPNLILLYLFSLERGYVSKFLGNKIFVYLAGLTFEAYLIHQVVNMYFYIVPGMNGNLPVLSKLKCSIFIIVMTFLLAELIRKNNLFDRISKKILNEK